MRTIVLVAIACAVSMFVLALAAFSVVLAAAVHAERKNPTDNVPSLHVRRVRDGFYGGGRS